MNERAAHAAAGTRDDDAHLGHEVSPAARV
jgi:hypothetical protein